MGLPIFSGSAGPPWEGKWAGGRHATLHVLQPEMVSPFYRFIMDLISISKSSKPLLPFLSPVLKVTLQEGNRV